MTCGLDCGGKDGEDRGIGFVEESRTFATYDTFVFWVTLFEFSCFEPCWRYCKRNVTWQAG